MASLPRYVDYRSPRVAADVNAIGEAAQALGVWNDNAERQLYLPGEGIVPYRVGGESEQGWRVLSANYVAPPGKLAVIKHMGSRITATAAPSRLTITPTEGPTAGAAFNVYEHNVSYDTFVWCYVVLNTGCTLTLLTDCLAVGFERTIRAGEKPICQVINANNPYIVPAAREATITHMFGPATGFNTFTRYMVNLDGRPCFGAVPLSAHLSLAGQGWQQHRPRVLDLHLAEGQRLATPGAADNVLITGLEHTIA